MKELERLGVFIFRVLGIDWANIAAKTVGINGYVKGQEKELEAPFDWSQKTDLILDLIQICILNCVFLQSYGNITLFHQPSATELLEIAITRYIKALWEKIKCF